MEEKGQKKNRNEMLDQIKKQKGVFSVYIILRVLIAVIMIKQFFAGNYQNVFLCLLVLILFIVPGLIEKGGGIRLPDTLEMIILLFIFAAEILGDCYVTFCNWVSRPLRAGRRKRDGCCRCFR